MVLPLREELEKKKKKKSSRWYDRHVRALPQLRHSYFTTTGKQYYQLKLNMPKNDASGIQTNSFYYSTVKVWNETPKIVKHAKNINIFQTKLDEVWKDLP